MAYTLKSAWSSRVVACVAVDQDNTTVKDFKSGNSISLGTGVSSGVGSTTWKGNTRYYFPTLANGTFNFYGVTWNATVPTAPFGTTASVMLILNTYTSSSGWCFGNNGAQSGLKISSSKPQWFMASGARLTANTSLATSTKQTSMGIWRNAGTCEFHYGLESGSMGTDGSNTDTGFGGNINLDSFGGVAGQGNFVSQVLLFLVTNDAISNTDRDNLHSDFVGTLFDTSGGSTVPVLMANYRSMMGN